MGKIAAHITLTNALDWLRGEPAEDGEEPRQPYRQVALDAHVGTGSTKLCIPADAARALGLRETSRTTMVLADASTREAAFVGPIHLEVLGRSMIGQALVLPEGAAPLLGVIPLESMDLALDPQQRALRVADERGPRMSVKKVRDAHASRGSSVRPFPHPRGRTSLTLCIPEIIC